MSRFGENSKQLLSKRSFIIITAFVVASVILVLGLVDLQFIRAKEFAEEANTKHTRTLKIPGTRGKILDSNGIPLAQDEKNYNLEFYREYNLIAEREQYTNSIIKAIEIINKYDRDIIPTFAITKSEGEYVFNWGNVSDATKAAREKTWRSDFYFATKKGLAMSVEDMYLEMRKRYHIPEDLSDEMAFKVLGIWQDSIQSYWASKSITVLKNLSLDLAMAIESYSYELSGFSITENAMRVYPQGTVGSHIVGYLGRITSENVEYYNQQNYDIESLVGVAGIENVMESYLTGSSGERQGSRVVEVTSSGRILSEISNNPAKNGDNVYLTIDTNLQRVAEDALRANIQQINETQHARYEANKAYYDNIIAERGGKELQYAKIGACVVMDVHTGKVKAIASEPNYDPNLFSRGISDADYKAIIEDERKPLFDKAISSSDTPGSIFKLCISVAGLEEGAITVDETIADLGEYKKYVSGNEKGPMCGWYRDNGETHGNINVESAITYSCNYFFYEVADRIGIEKIKKWADNFGLLEKTNVELTGEKKGLVGDQETLYDSSKELDNQDTSLPTLVNNQLNSIIDDCAKRSGKELLDVERESIISSLFGLVGKSKNEIFQQVESILIDGFGMNTSVVKWDIRYQIYSSIVQITWTNTNTIQTGIGQSITTVTPIGVARYISALVNGGYVYDAHIVEKVTTSTGELVYEQAPTLVRKLDIKEEYFAAVKKGMQDMVADSADRYSSTARNYFQQFKYKNELGGKTGTAQVSDINLEDNAWFVAFAPYDNPEIAIVTYIPNGFSGSMASSTVKEISEYYLDKKYVNENTTLPESNSIIY